MRLGQHYREHQRRWVVEYPKDYEHKYNPYDNGCLRCRISYQLQRIRWWISGDIIV